eukprot:GFKZ01008171.1.p1 GENE.GFKZ01008171.1~~GFKZ01008171.1.p1  ORF type:complete len:382 (-),score=62.79 GFKZ01008171.1:1425-2570(-)
MNETVTQREYRIERFCQFQRAELEKLESRLEHLNQDMQRAELEVLRAVDFLGAARGLAQMRGVRVEKMSKGANLKRKVWTNGDGELERRIEYNTEGPQVRIGLCGVVYTGFRKRFEAPRQSFVGDYGKGVVVLGNSQLQGLRQGVRVWLIYWLDRNDGLWRNFVRPPRAKGGWRVGLFSTRSPNRPTPIGLSLCVVEGVDCEAGKVFVDGLDVLDETPLIGMKLYEEKEAWFGVKAGWVDEMERLRPLYYDEVDGYSNREQVDILVQFENEADKKLDFIDSKRVPGTSIDIRCMIVESLKRTRHTRSRHSVDTAETGATLPGVLPVGAFRILYELVPSSKSVVVYDILSGMRRSICEEEAETDLVAELHLEFQNLFQQEKT